jgi:hypothetical protein
MTRATIAVGAFVTVLVVLVFVLVVQRPPLKDAEPAARAAPGTAKVQPGFIYGRVAVDGDTYEGRLRWGGDQEAFWNDYFDGAKPENPWAVHAPGVDSPIEIFGFEIGGSDRRFNPARPFMARFGDLARIEANFGTVKVMLKSGTAFELDRFSAGDIDDGVRVWDGRHGAVDVDARDIRTIELLDTAPLVADGDRLHGTVRTRQGEFSGFIQWNRQDGLGADRLEGRTADGAISLRYDTLRSIARHSRDSILATLLDGREMVVSATSDAGRGNRGIHVDDGRYGRVLISWDTFERIEFSAGGSGPAYSDFAPGRPLAGAVTTREGRRVVGRLVYDFDESETTETFDASSEGVNYTIAFGLIRSIVLAGGEARADARGAQRARVILHDGEALPFELAGDLGAGNAGMLIFVAGGERPEYVPWNEVAQIDFDPPSTGDR